MAALGSVANALTLAQITDPSSDDTDRMTLLVAHASEAIRNYTGLDFDQATTTDKFPGTWDSILTLPQWPVTAVTTVKVNDTTVTGWQWDGRRGIRRWTAPTANLDYHSNAYPWDDTPSTRQGAARRGSDGSWNGPDATIEVTYTHGFSSTPADVAALCEAMAASGFNVPSGIRQEQIGSYSVTYAVEAMGSSVTMTILEAKQLDNYRDRYL